MAIKLEFCIFREGRDHSRNFSVSFSDHSLTFQILQKQLESIKLNEKPAIVSRFMEVFKTLWPLNGDHISRIYSGTGAMEAGTKGTVSNVFVESNFKKILLKKSPRFYFHYIALEYA